MWAFFRYNSEIEMRSVCGGLFNFTKVCRKDIRLEKNEIVYAYIFEKYK